MYLAVVAAEHPPVASELSRSARPFHQPKPWRDDAPPRSIARLDSLFNQLCWHFRVHPVDVQSSCRNNYIAFIRHTFVWLSRRMTGFSYPDLADYLGRDHSTLVANMAKFRGRLDGDPAVKAEIDAIEKDLLYVGKIVTRGPVATSGAPWGQRKPLTRRRHPVRREELLQKSAVCLLRRLLPPSWKIHHSRNGGKSKGENGRAKAMGALAGFPDLQILGRRDVGFEKPLWVPWVWHIEFKRPKTKDNPGGHLDSTQRALHADLVELGFTKPAVIDSLEDLLEFLRVQGIPHKDYKLF